MTYQLALFGHPVNHSLSPEIHRDFARQFNLDINYQLIDVNTDKLNKQVQSFFAQGGHGANVTVPHKQQVMAVVDHLTERAQQASAVNTLSIRNNQLWGDNTDGDGLVNDFKHKEIQTNNRRLLIIGAGGAVQGILPALLATGPQQIFIHNRTPEKAQRLANQSPQCQVLSSDTNTGAFDVIINGTSMGHHGISPPLKAEWINPQTQIYDLSYGQAARAFLHQAKQLGAEKVYDGLGMLHHQAVLAFNQWFNHMPELNISTDKRSAQP